MDDQMTPEVWATMQKFSGSVRLQFLFYINFPDVVLIENINPLIF